MSYYDYFVRAKPVKYAKLLALAETLGILQTVDGMTVPTNPAWVWQPLGKIYKQTGPNPEDVEAVKAGDGTPFEHANLRMTVDLLEFCQAAYDANPDPELGAALAKIEDFFFTKEGDPTKRAARPNSPSVDFL